MTEKFALVLIDAQVNMFDDGCAVHGADSLLKCLKTLLSQARQTQIPIFFIQNNGGKGDPDEPGTEGWRIHPALAPQPGEVILQKRQTNAFVNPALQEELLSRGVQHLIIAGMQTEMCVHATCHGALERGYEVTIVADGHSTFSDEEQSAEKIIAKYNEEWASVANVVLANALKMF